MARQCRRSLDYPHLPWVSKGLTFTQLALFAPWHAPALGRHALVLVGAGKELYEQAFIGVAQRDDFAVFGAIKQALAGVQRETAFLLVAQMAVRAVLPQDGHDLMRKINGRRSWQTEQKKEAAGKTVFHGDREEANAGGTWDVARDLCDREHDAVTRLRSMGRKV